MNAKEQLEKLGIAVKIDPGAGTIEVNGPGCHDTYTNVAPDQIEDCLEDALLMVRGVMDVEDEEC